MFKIIKTQVRQRLGGRNRNTRRQNNLGRLELLESRVVPYATTGNAWPHPELVTVSFMPDASDVAGVPNTLFATFNSVAPTATWQKEMLRGLQSYAAVANINFSVTADDGAPLGSPGLSGSDNNMQGDSNFGDVRISAVPLAPNLGLAILPPPLNGDSSAGDFSLDTGVVWSLDASVHLFTVAAHEAGHSLGLGHSADTTAVMYTNYNGIKNSLTADDIAGIQAIYGVRPQDSFDATAPNNTKGNSTVITSYIDSNKQVTLTGLDLTSSTDIDWYKITTPSGSAPTMEVRVQSTGLSLLAPKMTVYKGSNNKGTVIGTYNSTISTIENIGSGQNWFVKVEAAEATVFGTGTYALQINMGTAPLPPVSSPNTATPSTGGGGGGLPTLSGHDEHDHDHASDHGSADAGSGLPVIVSPRTDFQGSARAMADVKLDSTAAETSSDVLLAQRPPHAADDGVQAASTAQHQAAAATDQLLADELLDAVLPGYGFVRELSEAV